MSKLVLMNIETTCLEHKVILTTILIIHKGLSEQKVGISTCFLFYDNRAFQMSSNNQIGSTSSLSAFEK